MECNGKLFYVSPINNCLKIHCVPIYMCMYYRIEDYDETFFVQTTVQPVSYSRIETLLSLKIQENG